MQVKISGRAVRRFVSNTWNWRTRKNWPRPHVKTDQEPHFLFVITTPYSGSTAFSKIINSCEGSTFLHRTGEGQWLVPGMRDDRWNPDKKIDWQSVRAVWLNRFEETRELVQKLDFVLEKSPPNMVRVDGLIDTFPNHTLMSFTRSPFAVCSSMLHHREGIAKKSERQRMRILRTLARLWLDRAVWVRKWAEKDDVISTTYERFCADPSEVVGKLAERIPAVSAIDVDQAIKIKDYQEQKLENQNPRQIGYLSEREISAISEVLIEDRQLVAYFGYDPEDAQFWT